MWQIKDDFLYTSVLTEIPWIYHFFTTRKLGDLKDTFLFNQILSALPQIDLTRIVSAEQVHQDGIAWIERHNGIQQVKNVDALITRIPKLTLIIRTADCVPVIIVDKKNNCIAVVHAGRAGTEKEIIKKTLILMKQKVNTDPVECTVVLGPHIRTCCYPYNLTKENIVQLNEEGVPPQNIEVYDGCTSCEPDWFFSYRRDKGNTGRMFAGIQICG